ncbi:unnamed protein product, partial [Protopolystoma xenopodis]
MFLPAATGSWGSNRFGPADETSSDEVKPEAQTEVQSLVLELVWLMCIFSTDGRSDSLFARPPLLTLPPQRTGHVALPEVMFLADTSGGLVLSKADMSNRISTSSNLTVVHGDRSNRQKDMDICLCINEMQIKNGVYLEGFMLFSWTGVELCDVSTIMDVLCCTASILHLVAIAIDRYWAVTSVDYIRRRTASPILFMIAVVWIVSTAISVPSRFHPGRSVDEVEQLVLVNGTCIINPNGVFTIFSTVGAFFLPMCFLIGIYFKIYQAASSRIRKKKFQAKLDTNHKVKPTYPRPMPVGMTSSSATSKETSTRTDGQNGGHETAATTPNSVANRSASNSPGRRLQQTVQTVPAAVAAQPVRRHPLSRAERRLRRQYFYPPYLSSESTSMSKSTSTSTSTSTSSPSPSSRSDLLCPEIGSTEVAPATKLASTPLPNRYHLPLSSSSPSSPCSSSCCSASAGRAACYDQLSVSPVVAGADAAMQSPQMPTEGEETVTSGSVETSRRTVSGSASPGDGRSTQACAPLAYPQSPRVPLLGAEEARTRAPDVDVDVNVNGDVDVDVGLGDDWPDADSVD